MIMKKFLLMALSTLIVGTATAQKFTKQGKIVKTNSVVSKDKLVKQQITTAPIKEEGFSRNRIDFLLSKKFNIRDTKQLKATNGIVTNYTKRSGELQAEYTGTGRVTGRGTAPWTMLSGTLVSTGEACLADIIPNPYPDNIPNIAVPYTLSGSTITVQPVAVASFQDGSNLIIFGGTNADGSFTMTLGDDGSLTIDEDESIFYGAFYNETFDPTLETYDGYVEYVENIKYALPGQEIAPTASYEPEGFFLFPGLTVDFSYYSNAIIPAYAPVKLASNTTDAANTWSWTLNEAVWTGSSWTQGDVVATSDKNTFEFTTIGDAAYEPASFVAAFNDKASEPFTLTAGNWYAGLTGDTFDPAIITKANPGSSKLTSFNTDGIHSFILYQGKPAAPLFFTGVNLMVDEFSANSNFKLTCKIHKATRSASGAFMLGELIAQADVDKEDIVIGSQCTQLNWNEFYVEDEFGMSVTLDYLLIDEEFAVVFEGFDNGTFVGTPLGAYPVGAVNKTSTYVIITGEEEYTGFGFQNFYGNVFAGFKDSGYGWLYTEDDTNVTIPADGGEVSITVNPMFYANDENGNATTYLWLDDEEALPEWLGFAFANEKYTEEDYNNGTWGFDLVFSADALPAGVTNREAELTFVQDLAKLVVKVSQSGEATGITTTVTKVTEDGKAYDLSGRVMKAGQKGLVIKNGKKYIVK